MSERESLLDARDPRYEIALRMATIILGRWDKDSVPVLDGLIERLLIEDDLKFRVTYHQHACWGEAYTARMLSENPELSPETRQAYLWAEAQFVRVARGEVGERDLVG